MPKVILDWCRGLCFVVLGPHPFSTDGFVSVPRGP